MLHGRLSHHCSKNICRLHRSWSSIRLIVDYYSVCDFRMIRASMKDEANWWSSWLWWNPNIGSSIRLYTFLCDCLDSSYLCSRTCLYLSSVLIIPLNSSIAMYWSQANRWFLRERMTSRCSGLDSPLSLAFLITYLFVHVCHWSKFMIVSSSPSCCLFYALSTIIHTNR